MWVGRNKGSGWGTAPEPLEDPVPLDLEKAKEYVSGDVTLPGDHPPRAPSETFDRATKTDGYEVLYNDPKGTVAKDMAKNLEKQAKRQVDALPDGAVLEWHCSTQKGATALRNLLSRKHSAIKVVYTPRRGV